MSNQTETRQSIGKGYGFAFACWTRLMYRGEWEWVTAHFRPQRLAAFSELRS